MHFFVSLLYKTNRFQVAVHLFSTRSQMMSKCGKDLSGLTACVTLFLFLPSFYIICVSITEKLNTNIFVKCMYYDQVLPVTYYQL